jgi:ribosomal protein S18 acetylase RimI-like enzyme
MGFLVRPPRVEDAAAVAHVNVAAWRYTYAHLLSPDFLAALDEQQFTERYKRRFADRTEGFVVLEVDGEVRGYAMAGAPESDDDPRDLQLYMIYQLPSEHGSGSGQALLDAVLGDRPAFLWVAEDNPRTIAFYRRNRFEPDGATESIERWESLPTIRMVR